MEKEEIIKAHQFSSNHKQTLLKDKKCGCFHCLKVFNPIEIREWIDDTYGTAISPYCGIDSIIGESSRFQITREFLKKMQGYWF